MEEFEEGEFGQNLDGEENHNQTGDVPIPVAQQEVVQSPVTVVHDFFRTGLECAGNERLMGSGRSPVAQGTPEVQETININDGLEMQDVHGGVEELAQVPKTNEDGADILQNSKTNRKN
ncbi:hypothetical protein Hanom_Chr04g00304261 [Helianthus anomalus]